MSTTTWETREVLAGAYASKNPKSLLTHAVEVDQDGRELRVACGRVELDNIADHYSGDVTRQPTCSRCRRH